MSSDGHPALVAYDGSPAARAAVEAAATLFGSRGLVVVSVWEPGLAMAMSTAPASDLQGLSYIPVSGEEVIAIDRAQRDRAMGVAEEGVRLAESLGATARAQTLEDDVNVADSVARLADELAACAVVVGTRGHGAVKAKLLGSTSADLVHRAHRPVVIVAAPE